MTDDLNELVNLLGDSDPAPSLAAAEELALLGPEAQAVAVALVRAMGTENEEVREQVVAALEELGPPTVEQLSELALLLEDPRAEVGYWAATLLGRLGEIGGDATPSLIDAAAKNSTQLPVRERAVWALGQIGRPAAAALPVLRELAHSPNLARLARLAAAASERIGR